MSIATELERIQKAKSDIKTSIINKGVAVDDAATIDTYASKIDEIQAGGVSGNLDLSGTGWENGEPTFPVNIARLKTLQQDLDYTRTKFSEWDPEYTSAYGHFQNDANLVYAPKIDTSERNDTGLMFSSCKNLTAVPTLNTSRVTSMWSMFSDCSSLTSIPLFDTSKARDMSNMFQGCSSLTTIPLFDTSGANNIQFMLQDCKSLISVPDLNTSKVTSFQSAFSGCENLVHIPELDVSSATHILNCFHDCRKIESITLKGTGKIENMENAFGGCTSLKSVELSGGILPDCNCNVLFIYVETTGVLKIHTDNTITRANYQPVIDRLPPTWTVEEISDL